MRTDERDTTLDLLRPSVRHCIDQHLGQGRSLPWALSLAQCALSLAQCALSLSKGIKIDGGPILSYGVIFRRRNIGVRLADVRRQISQRRQPRLEQFGAGAREMGVPDLEGRLGVRWRRAASRSAAERLEQSVA